MAGCAGEEPSAPPRIEPASSKSGASSQDGARTSTATSNLQESSCICQFSAANLDATQSDSSLICLTGCDFCGDGLCSGGETAFTCPDDCGGLCGDGICAANESSSTCSADCGLPPPPPTSCGTGICANAYSVTSAQAQARYAWAAYCRLHPGLSAGGTVRPGFDYLTDQSVTTYSTSSASLQPYLFPIYYDFVTAGAWNAPDAGGTNCSLLPTSAINATLCVAGCTPSPVCGNGACESGESSSSCPADCGPVCGNGLCEAGEDQFSCSVDCGGGCVLSADESFLTNQPICPL